MLSSRRRCRSGSPRQKYRVVVISCIASGLHGRRGWGRVGGLWLGLGLFPHVDLGRVAGEVAEDVAVQSIADELLMNPPRQALRGEFGEGAGERKRKLMAAYRTGSA